MTLFSIVRKEFFYRSHITIVAIAAVAIAVAALIATAGLLRLFDASTESIISKKEKEVADQTEQLQEEYRKIGTSMGFNILVLPKDQDLADLYANDFATKTMPDWYIDTLAHSKIATIQHLLPLLQQKVVWPEQKRTVLAVGTMGEVKIASAETKKPMRDNVASGTIYLGYELHNSIGCKKGSFVKFMGRQFTVAGCYPMKGTKDDITLWINLKQAQEMFGKKGLLNGILALECQCAMAKPDQVRAEIGAILPNTQIVEFASQALTRAETRSKAADYAKAALLSEKTSRASLRHEKEKYFFLVLPLLIGTCVVFIGVLSYVNARQRRTEFGILRAIGFSAGRVAALVNVRSLLIGVIGSIAGAVCGFCALIVLAMRTRVGVWSLVDIAEVVFAIVLAPVCTMVCGWLGAMPVLGEDPAEIVKGE